MLRPATPKGARDGANTRCPSGIISLVSNRQPFYEQLNASWDLTDSLLCVGIDPLPDKIPACVGSGEAGLFDFCKNIVDAVAPLVCALKPQAAHFGALAAENVLAELIGYIHQAHPHVVVVLDAKRGDIGSTAERYAEEAFVRYDADAVTVNPLLGEESVLPYFAHPDRGVILLCRTSNPGSAWLQMQGEGQPVYLQIAAQAQAWNQHNNLALVTGATYPDELSAVREVAPELPLLVPGIGAQGGDIRRVVACGANAEGRGLLISASRSVLYASAGEDFADAAKCEAERLREEIRLAVAGRNVP